MARGCAKPPKAWDNLNKQISGFMALLSSTSSRVALCGDSKKQAIGSNTQLCHTCVTELYPSHSVLRACLAEFKADLIPVIVYIKLQTYRRQQRDRDGE
jgi:hypothetical protein